MTFEYQKLWSKSEESVKSGLTLKKFDSTRRWGDDRIAALGRVSERAKKC
jgi:hypothetical protein